MICGLGVISLEGFREDVPASKATPGLTSKAK